VGLVNRIHGVALGLLIALPDTQPRLTSRPLVDIAEISIPASIKNERYRGYHTEQESRLTFHFSSTYLWASMGSTTAYKQLLVVSIMAPDATDAEYTAYPRALPVSYEQRRKVSTSSIGSGSLTITEGRYTVGNLDEPAFEYLYIDKSRRLQLAWHAVKKEVEMTSGVAQIAQIASSFRMLRDPLDTFAELRAAPGKDAAERARKVAVTRDMLHRAGYASLIPGSPVLRDGVYLEWMTDPEPRYQLLVPLGRVRAAPPGNVLRRPRPIRHPHGDSTDRAIAESIGWREVQDDAWLFTNEENAYLPMVGIGRLLAAQQQDRGYVYFYYAATVRVEEEPDDRRLTSLRWFLDDLPEVTRRWRAGRLLGVGTPEPD
jgi:hypothetical protein